MEKSRAWLAGSSNLRYHQAIIAPTISLPLHISLSPQPYSGQPLSTPILIHQVGSLVRFFRVCVVAVAGVGVRSFARSMSAFQGKSIRLSYIHTAARVQCFVLHTLCDKQTNMSRIPPNVIVVIGHSVVPIRELWYYP